MPCASSIEPAQRRAGGPILGELSNQSHWQLVADCAWSSSYLKPAVVPPKGVARSAPSTLAGLRYQLKRFWLIKSAGAGAPAAIPALQPPAPARRTDRQVPESELTELTEALPSVLSVPLGALS